MDENQLDWKQISATALRLLAVVVAAVGKEFWDAQGHGTPDPIDALATVAGGCAMLGWLLYAAPAIAKIT